MQALHNLLSKMQDAIARTGECDPNDLAEANRLLSADGVDLEFKRWNGVSIKQMILGQNRFGDIRLCPNMLRMPPIEPLLQHEKVVQCTSEVDRAVRRTSMSRSKLLIGVVGAVIEQERALIEEVGAVVAVVTGVIGVVGIPGAVAGLMAAMFASMAAVSAAIGAVATAGIAGVAGVVVGVARGVQTVRAVEAAGYRYLSTYHNPFVFTNKNWLRIKEAIKSLFGLKEKSAQKILSLDEVVKQAQPTKEQKLAALNEIQNIPDLIERKKALENAVGLGEQGKDHPYYRFFSYQRLWTTASAERGTLKLAHDALAETNKLIDADIQAQVKDVFDSNSTKKIADKIGFDLNKYLEKMSLLEKAPSAPSEAPTNFPLAPRHAPAVNDEVRTALRQ